jgi:hypothetical protein
VRIYDHLFASSAIHVFEVHEHEYMEIGRSYRLNFCPRPEQHFKVPSRYVEHVKKNFEFVPKSCMVGQHCDIDTMYGNTPVTTRNIGLELLLVSRQIYHEARLKPFTKISFHCNARYLGHIDAFSRLLDQMSPPQRQAIARLRLIIEHHCDEKGGPIGLPWRSMPDKKTILKLKGLRDLEMVLSPSFWEQCDANDHITQLVDKLKPCPTLQVLKILCLRSLRITLEPQFDQRYHDGIYATFASRNETDILKYWLKQTELELHFNRYVALGEEPVPAYGVKQDDPTSRALPWASPEELEEARLEMTEQAKESQVEAELVSRIMMERMCRRRDVEDYTQSDLDEIQEEAFERRRREDEERYGRW